MCCSWWQCFEGAGVNKMAYKIEQVVYLSKTPKTGMPFSEKHLGECAVPGRNVMKEE
jgi:hypothetical protein